MSGHSIPRFLLNGMVYAILRTRRNSDSTMVSQWMIFMAAAVGMMEKVEGRLSMVFKVCSQFIPQNHSPLTLISIAMAEYGIVGRGVLLDFHSWRIAQDPPIPYDAFQTGSIPLKYLLAVAEAQGTEIRFGDILIIRSGRLALFEGVSIQQLIL
jgi:hypothetical protein